MKLIPIDWMVWAPAIAMASGALLALVSDLLTVRRSFLLSWLPMVAGAGSAVALVVLHHSVEGNATHGFLLTIAVGTLLVVVASAVLHADPSLPSGEFQFLLGSAAAGGLVMVAAHDLVTLLVGLELLTLPSIALVGLRRGDRRAIASAWTFFLTSVVATAVTLTGIALLYGLAGGLRYADLWTMTNDPRTAAVAVGVLLTVVGFLFKLGTVPFHAWVPDVYRSASPVVTAFLASVSKAAALGALLVLILNALRAQHSLWGPAIAAVAAVTMTLGNVGALRQKDGVAVLAWSSVAQAGFLLAPAMGGDWTSLVPIQNYLAVYALANVVAFAALAVVLKVRGSTSFADLAGLARTDPLVGVPLAFAVLTLAGFPPAVIGLVTKFFLFAPVVQDGAIWLAVVMAVNVMIGLAYYLTFVATLFAPGESGTFRSTSGSWGVRVATGVVILGALTLAAASIWPSLLFEHVVPYVPVPG